MPIEEPDSTPPVQLSLDETWFRGEIDQSAPWLDEDQLLPAPEDVEYGYIDGPHADEANPDSIVRVDSRHALYDAIKADDKIKWITVPGYDRFFPSSLILPHTQQIHPAIYRASLRKAALWPLLITIGAGYFAFESQQPLFFILALFYGLFPLINTALDFFRHPERQSVAELNRSLVNGAFFSVWIKKVGRSPVLIIGIAALVVIYFLQVGIGLERSIELAALVKEKVRAGEFWRLLTAGFLHGHPMHILFNGMALHSLGKITVATSRKGETFSIFLLSVLGGSLASQFLTPNGSASVGASGGIMGLLGYMGVFVWKFRSTLPQHLVSGVARTFLMMVLLGVIGAGFIDNAAHAGGAIAGALIAFARYSKLSLNNPTGLPVFLRTFTLAILSATALWLIYRFAIELN